jgi:hypothetical protein
MNIPIVIEGTLKPDGTLELDGKVNLPPGRVQLIVQPLPELPADDPFWQRMRAIWANLRAAGHIPRSAEEVEAERESLREEWAERSELLERAQEQEHSRRSTGQPGQQG